MANQSTPSRQQEIIDLWQNYHGLYVLAGILIGILMFPFLELLMTNLRALLTDLVPEAVGITITVVLIERIAKIRDEQNQEQNYKEQLIRDAGSTSNEIAKNALHQMHKHDWSRGQGSLLINQNFRGANWQKSEIWKANLDESDLKFVKLQRAYVYSSSLRDVDLRYSELVETDLRGTDLSGANLHHADLVGAIISGTNVNGKFRSAIFDENTILPDGSSWSPDTDMSKFGVLENYMPASSQVEINKPTGASMQQDLADIGDQD